MEPFDPMNNADDVIIAARQMFHMYQALIDAGFTTDQAMQILTSKT